MPTLPSDVRHVRHEDMKGDFDIKETVPSGCLKTDLFCPDVNIPSMHQEGPRQRCVTAEACVLDEGQEMRSGRSSDVVLP